MEVTLLKNEVYGSPGITLPAAGNNVIYSEAFSIKVTVPSGTIGG